MPLVEARNIRVCVEIKNELKSQQIGTCYTNTNMPQLAPASQLINLYLTLTGN